MTTSTATTHCSHTTSPCGATTSQQDQLIPPTEPGQGQAMLNWSYFKPKSSGNPEEDVEVYLLRTNDWMEAHNFPEAMTVQRFCLTSTREARLWYEYLRPIVINWQGLQDQFRQQYS